MSLKGWLVISAFVLVLLLDIYASFLILWAQALAREHSLWADVEMFGAWISVVISLIWTSGHSLLRLILAAAPFLVFVGMLAYEGIVNGDY